MEKVYDNSGAGSNREGKERGWGRWASKMTVANEGVHWGQKGLWNQFAYSFSSLHWTLPLTAFPLQDSTSYLDKRKKQKLVNKVNQESTSNGKWNRMEHLFVNTEWKTHNLRLGHRDKGVTESTFEKALRTQCLGMKWCSIFPKYSGCPGFCCIPGFSPLGYPLTAVTSMPW